MNVSGGKINALGEILEFRTPKGVPGTVRICATLGEGSASQVFEGRAEIGEAGGKAPMGGIRVPEAQASPGSASPRGALRNINVAVKVLRPELAGTPMAERFARESLLLCSLSHPAIVQGLASGKASVQTDPCGIAPKPWPGIAHIPDPISSFADSASPAACDDPGLLRLQFLVMERVGGVPLASMMRQGGIDPKLAIEIAIGVAGALEHIRQDGRVVAHRDIKPANIMVLPDGSPKLMDLGVAKTMVQVDSALQTRVAGTLHYMAPEQMADSSKADIRSDLFSLGLVVYEMLGGVLGRDERDVLARRMAGEPLRFDDRMMGKLREAPQDAEFDLSEGSLSGLERVLQKMCAFEPQERYRFPRQASSDLAAVLEGRTPEYLPPEIKPHPSSEVPHPRQAPEQLRPSNPQLEASGSSSTAAERHAKVRRRFAMFAIAVIMIAVLSVAAMALRSPRNADPEPASSPNRHYAPPEGRDIVVPSEGSR